LTGRAPKAYTHLDEIRFEREYLNRQSVRETRELGGLRRVPHVDELDRTRQERRSAGPEKNESSGKTEFRDECLDCTVYRSKLAARR